MFQKGKIQDVVVYPLKKFVDERGWLAELFRHDELTEKGVVVNCPNRLFMGAGKKEEIDEIRHEDDPQTIFTMDD